MMSREDAARAVRLSDAEAWEAFRTLAHDGDDLYTQLRGFFWETGVFDLPGDTLEVGAGDATLWRGDGERLLEVAATKGRVVLTDADAQCVEACRPLGRAHPVTAEMCDVHRLPYADAAFARVLAVQVLHWCPSADATRAAVCELARVTRPDGRAVIVTVDERVHMTEIYSLMQQAKERLLSAGVPFDVEVPQRPPRIARFCAANAYEHLRASFGVVRRVDLEYSHRVEQAHPTLRIAGADLIARYIASAPFLREAGAADDSKRAFLHAVRDLVGDAIAQCGAFRVSRCDVVFDCAAPRRAAPRLSAPMPEPSR